MSANSVSKLVYAQSNSLAQKGNSQADQLKEQLQSSNQDNQLVSGDSSVLSGNNLQCQDQKNSKDIINDNVICLSPEQTSNPPPLTVSRNILILHIFDDSRITGTITVSDSMGSETIRVNFEDAAEFVIPINDKYTVTYNPGSGNPNGLDITFLSKDCKRIGNSFSCSGVMSNSPQSVSITVMER